MEKTYFITKEQYLAVKAAWSTRSNHTAWEIVLYNALRSKPLKNGFVECNKVSFGQSKWQAFGWALNGANMAIASKNPWEQYRGNERYATSIARADERIEQDRVRFQKTFGIDIPEGLKDLLKDE